CTGYYYGSSYSGYFDVW
nr:immunoglobulin heavy chain junction region [Mus musculus]